MQTMFRDHLSMYPPNNSEVYELKICKGTSLPFDSVKEHQVEALLNVQSSKGIFHKLTDQPWIKDRPYMFTLPKPFDCMFLKQLEAYVVLWFYKPRQKKIFIKIRIDKWLELQDTCGRKSITEEMAINNGEKLYIITKKS